MTVAFACVVLTKIRNQYCPINYTVYSCPLLFYMLETPGLQGSTSVVLEHSAYMKSGPRYAVPGS